MKADFPSLNTLCAFSVVAQTLSYKDAADALNVTPAAVKQLVSKLESHFDTPLVLREGKGLKLSAVGKECAEKLQAGFQLVYQAAEDMRRHNRPSDRLVISVEPFFAQSWLLPRLHRFREVHPQIDVWIDASLELKSVTGDGVDGVIRYGGPPDGGASDGQTGTLFRLELFKDVIVPLCSPVLARSLSVDPGELLEQETFIHWDLSGAPWTKQTSQWYSFEHYWDKVGLGGFSARKNIYFTDYNMAVQAAVSGQGIILGSLPILREMVASKMLDYAMPYPVETNIGYEFMSAPSASDFGPDYEFQSWLRDEIAKTVI